MEELELKGLMKIKRNYDSKLKKKQENYIFPKNIDEKVKNNLTKKQRQFWDFFTERKFVPIRVYDIVNEFSYSILKALKNKDLIEIVLQEAKEVDIFENKEKVPQNKKELTAEQKEVISKVVDFIEKGKPKIFLLQGITGSGKTEVYLELIKKTLNKGKAAILLLPEISIVSTIVNRFFASFDTGKYPISIIHSKLSERQKYLQWQKIKTGKSKIIIGTRSAIFAPITNLGILIIDEEHDFSYKQENAPRYNAKILAMMRAKSNSAVVVLGSATPSLESYENVKKGKYELLELKNRPGKAKLPKIEIVKLTYGDNLFSERLIKEISLRLQKKEQVILFQNRRAYASYLQCLDCGQTIKCSKCDVSMAYHKDKNILKCHYCGEVRKVQRTCPFCGSYKLSYGTSGTQKIEELLKEYFPKANILRLDKDSTYKKDSYNKMFLKMKNRNIDILLGTQMISKGLSFDNVTLVGVILADIHLNIPDFRAMETTFSLLTQVAGRAGRRNKEGLVIIQTYNPDNRIFQMVKEAKYQKFMEDELELRKLFFYPPYCRLAKIVFYHHNLEYLKNHLAKNSSLFNYLIDIFDGEILGPLEPNIEKIKNKYFMQLIIKSENYLNIANLIEYLKRNIFLPTNLNFYVDVDPVNLL